LDLNSNRQGAKKRNFAKAERCFAKVPAKSSFFFLQLFLLVFQQQSTKWAFQDFSSQDKINVVLYI
jgi:hypothetical protein